MQPSIASSEKPNFVIHPIAKNLIILFFSALLAGVISYNDTYILDSFLLFFPVFGIFLLSAASKDKFWYYWVLGVGISVFLLSQSLGYSDNVEAFAKLLPGALIIGIIFRWLGGTENAKLLVFSLVSSFLFGEAIFWRLYNYLFPQLGGGFFGFEAIGEAIIGVLIAYTFFIPLFLIGFGNRYKHIWTLILLVPVFIPFIAWDTGHLYFYFLIILAGWLIGLGIQYLMRAAKTRTP